MGRDYLTTAQKNALSSATRRTTLVVTLGDGTVLNLATADIDFGGVTYSAKLAPVDGLNLELTAAVEGIELKISNITLSLGRNLINTPDILSGTAAVLGTYFFDERTGEEWHDAKVAGEIAVGGIDGDWVNVFFTSKVDAVEYGGVSIASLFPDTQIPVSPAVQPIYNDINPIVPRTGGGGGISPFADDYRNGGRYVVPFSV